MYETRDELVEQLYKDLKEGKYTDSYYGKLLTSPSFFEEEARVKCEKAKKEVEQFLADTKPGDKMYGEEFSEIYTEKSYKQQIENIERRANIDNQREWLKTTAENIILGLE